MALFWVCKGTHSGLSPHTNLTSNRFWGPFQPRPPRVKTTSPVCTLFSPTPVKGVLSSSLCAKQYGLDERNRLHNTQAFGLSGRKEPFSLNWIETGILQLKNRRWWWWKQIKKIELLSLILLLSYIKRMKKVQVLVTQSCPTLHNPMDCSPPGSSVRGILQARQNTGVGGRSLCQGISWPRGRAQFSGTAGGFFTVWTKLGWISSHCFYCKSLRTYSWPYSWEKLSHLWASIVLNVKKVRKLC